MDNVKDDVDAVQGLPDFMRERARQILLNNALLFQGLAQVYAPVRTGYLRDHIEIEDRGDVILVVSRAPYSAIVEARQPFMSVAWDQVKPQLEDQLRSIQQEIDAHVNNRNTV